MTSDAEERLAAIFQELGARDAKGWARSQVDEGIPQLARFLFLRQAWSKVLGEGDVRWIPAAIESAKTSPTAPYSGTGHALERILSHGVDPGDLSEVVRGMQVELLFNLCYLLEDPGDVPPSAADVSWALVQVTQDGEVLDAITGLHESVLETDPTGRVDEASWTCLALHSKVRMTTCRLAVLAL